MFEISFGSDNHSGVHPLILKALTEANSGYCPAYGDDPLTQRVLAKLEALFGNDCEAFIVMTGTGANVLSLQTLIRSYNAVICANTAHINVDECGAVQKNTSARLVVIEVPDGKLSPELIEPRLMGNRDQHHSQMNVISISQSTEYGTLYSLREIKALADFAHARGMYLHLDGARLANAAAALDIDFRTMCKDTGVDLVSLGGTKNGMLFGEAIISFRPDLTEDLRFYRKQCNQLFSKMRFISAQFDAYLSDELWRSNALHANRMAALLASRLAEIGELCITQKPQVNSVFVKLPHALIAPLQEEYHFYTWDEAGDEVRLMCSFDTTEEHIDHLCGRIRELLET
ncbi:MAG TPA: beta-eliminating lyase-related protein [Candidatus Cloacimonadota bacterium]|nr:beta-eliminating lyase-related protein [Candidatus Cloacimonadota bacterium]